MRSQPLQSKARWAANKSVSDFYINRGVAALICQQNKLQLNAKLCAVDSKCIDKAKRLRCLARSQANAEEPVSLLPSLVGRELVRSNKQERDISIGPQAQAHLAELRIPIQMKNLLLIEQKSST